ncbi:hypothetical protein RIF29_26268 [Crotalaria pallida]|uniref:Uncharacterized protein n=1 Tax=Crotalaria pallida TaxID=3830 RepID=A0AAN9EUS7_CROPI
MDPMSTNTIDEEWNLILSQLDSSMTRDVMKNTQEQDPQSKKLADILMKSVLESQNSKGKNLKNPVVAEQIVSFCLPQDCDLADFKDIGEVIAKLKGWKIQSTQRDTKIYDTVIKLSPN